MVAFESLVADGALRKSTRPALLAEQGWRLHDELLAMAEQLEIALID
jgi:hypothetical protein